jgi:hypothetical protein
MTDCNEQKWLFQELGYRKVEVDFGGGYLSSDGGACHSIVFAVTFRCWPSCEIANTIEAERFLADKHAGYPPAIVRLKAEEALEENCRHRPVQVPQ